MSLNPTALTARLAPAKTLLTLQQARPALQRFGGEFVWVCVGQIAAALGCIAGVRLLTEVMPPAEYGTFMLAMTFVGLVQQVLASPLSVATQRFYSVAAEEGQLVEYGSAVVSSIGRTILLIIVQTALIVALFAFFRSTTPAITVVLSSAAFAILLSVTAVLDAMLNAARLRKSVAFHQAATQWSRWFAAAGFVLLLGSSANAAMLGGCLALAALCVTRFLTLQRVIGSSPRIHPSNSQANVNWQQHLCDYGRPFAMWGFFTWAFAASDRWALALCSGQNTVGDYAVLYQLGFFPCVMLADALQQFVSPILFQRAGMGGDADRYRSARSINRRLLIILAALVLMCFALAWLLHRPLLYFLAGSQFRNHSVLLPWCVLAGGLFALGQLATLSIVSGPTAHSLLPVKIGSAVFGIAVNFAGAGLYGLDGVTGAMVISSGVYFAWTLWVVRTAPFAIQRY